MTKDIPFLLGTAAMKSNLSIEEVGKILSNRLFGDLKFEGKEKNIYDEVPAMYIESDIIGLRFVLSGYSGMGENERFVLEINPIHIFEDIDQKAYRLDSYLTLLLKDVLVDVQEIQVMDIR